jgi:microcystin degradation protein MlrC
MFRILIAELKQETATFNPAPTVYADFRIHVGGDIIDAYRGTKTELAGALDVFEESESDKIEIIPTIAAAAVSGGRIVDSDLNRLLSDVVESAKQNADVDGMYVCLHGAMAGETENDPEGRLLAGLREIFGDKPIVASIDLHAILTDRMIEAADILVPYHTYPHVDHYETGQRAARLLLRLLRGEIHPVTSRVALPMLVRGDELITATGRFGEAIRECQAIEASDAGLAAGVIIGNPFTDVPDLQSNVLVTTDDAPEIAAIKAGEIARFMWDNRELFQAPLTSIQAAIGIAESTEGLTVFSDAADATASGASGDSNAILKALLNTQIRKPSLISIVDAPAVDAAFQAGTGATILTPLGGTRDPGRFAPIQTTATVREVFHGTFDYEDGSQAHPGRTVILVAGNIHILATEQPVFVVGQNVFKAHGLNPANFGVVVVKSPNGFRPYYESIAARIVPIDAPGSTSANLKSLPFENCVRPIFPLDENVPSPFAEGN